MFGTKLYYTQKGTQNGRISTRRSFPLRQQSEPTSFGAARGAPTSQGVVTFRADPPILQKCKIPDTRYIKKASLSEDFRLARVIGCEGIGATLEVFARSAAQLQQATKRGQ